MNPSTWIVDCRAACKQIKTLAEPFEWGQRPNRSGGWIAVASLLDSTGAAIPGLQVKFNWEKRAYEYSSYALMHSAAGTTRRVFMLEVGPAHKVTHTEPGLIVRGPHILLGDSKLGGITRPCIRPFKESDHIQWMQVFIRHARTLGGAYSLTTVSGPIFTTHAP